jgi:DNA-binding MarR family transcriptional regulator
LIYFDGATQQELANAMDISKGGLTKLLDRLEAKGMIEKITNKDDQRSKRIFLSNKAKLEDALSSAASESFSVLNPDEIQQLNKFMGKVRGHLLRLID